MPRLPIALHLLIPVASLFAFSSSAVAQDAADVIEQAREFIGKERDLDAVRSVRFVGTIEDDQGGTGTVEIVFQKPLHHRITIQVQDTTDVKALDDYEAWNHTRNSEGQWRLRILEPGEVSRLRAIVWENLNFFQGLERAGGRTVVRGRETVDGIDCVRMDFIHPGDTTFTRFFDRKTGRLVLTRSDENTVIREEGEIRQAGVRFPKRVITVTTFREIPEGGGEPVSRERKTTITFDSVTVNDTFSRDQFAVPFFTGMP